ncbi:MAG: NAD(P)/FAD-dependent oxidoreductase [Nitrososphaerales archaeon]
MARRFDVVVAGGSIAGLTFAAEAAKRGLSVLVAEEHNEIGEPEKCDGLVSLRGLKSYGHPPRSEVVQNEITSGVIHSPRGKHFTVDATALDVVVLDRSAYDKQVADEARANGAEVVTEARASDFLQVQDEVSVEVGRETVTAKYFVDATGPASSPGAGILPAAKYELEGDWVRERTVEVFLDAKRFPGFFAWVIPFGQRMAKVGAAGFGISPFKALDSFLADKPHRILRKVSAPIYVGGPAPRFVSGRKVLVGESAGQVKPTTAGGIMTSVAGAMMAARWVSESLRLDDSNLLGNYQREWEAQFLREMKTMMRLRGLFRKLSNSDLDAIIATMATPRILRRLSKADFDFHGSALLGVLGIQGLARVARVVASSEVRSLLSENRGTPPAQQSI